MSATTDKTKAERDQEIAGVLLQEPRPARFNREDLTQRFQVNSTEYSFLLGISRRSLDRYSKDPEFSFLYGPSHTDHTGRKWWTPLQARLTVAVYMDLITLEKARSIIETHRAQFACQILKEGEATT